MFSAIVSHGGQCFRPNDNASTERSNPGSPTRIVERHVPSHPVCLMLIELCVAPLHHPSTRALLGLPSPSPPRFQQPARPAQMLSSSSPRGTSTDPSDSQASSRCERPREGAGEPISKGNLCVFQDAKGIPAQTLRHLESILRTQREQKARRFSEFLSLREKLIKEATSRVKDRQRVGALVSQPEGEVPGELARGPA